MRLFFEWLARSVSSAQLSELYHLFRALETDVDQKRYAHGLDKPLIETTDVRKLELLYRELYTSARYTKTYRSGIKLSALKHYIQFNREHTEPAPVAQAQPPEASNDAPPRQEAVAIVEKDAPPAGLGEHVANAPIEQPQPSEASSDTLPRQEAAAKVEADAPAAGLGEHVANAPTEQLQPLEASNDAPPRQEAAAKVEADAPAAGLGEHVVSTPTEQPQLLEPSSDTLPRQEAAAIVEKDAPAAGRDEHVANENRDAFFSWLKAQDLDTITLYSVLGTARKVDRLIISEGVSPLGLFASKDVGEIRAISMKIAANAAFIRADNAERHFWNETIGYYWQFADTLAPTSPEKPAEPETAPVTLPEKPANEPAAIESGPTEHGLTSEAGFRRWLQAHRCEEPADRAIDALRDAERFARLNDMLEVRFFGVPGPVARNTARQMGANKAYAKTKGSMAGVFKRVLPQFDAYAQWLKAPEPSAPQKDEPTRPAMDAALSELLSDELYGDLRAALIEKDILTLDAFRSLNLWVFLNQNGLYNIKQRNQIFRQLQPNPIQPAKAESAHAFTLKTQKAAYTGDTPAAALLRYCQAMAEKRPLSIRSAIGMSCNGQVVLKLRPGSDADLRLPHPAAYIDIHTNSDAALAHAKWLCKVCKDTDLPVSIEGGQPAPIVSLPPKPVEPPKPVVVEPAVEPSPTPVAPIAPVVPEAPEKPVIRDLLRERVEKELLRADLDGMTLDQLYGTLRPASMVALKKVRDTSPNIVEMPDGKLIHVGAFTELAEAGEQMGEIIEKLLNRNNGYASATQLYEYVRAEMQMFLNDNGISDEKSVYCIARHLFEKMEPRYAFTGYKHISRSGDGALRTKQDVIQNFAREHGGFFRYDDLAAYMEQVGFKQFTLGADYFFYSSDEIITSESMGIDEPWLQQVRRALDRLFDDMGDHVVLRGILPIWYDQLPTLPGYRPWTPLLFQYVVGAHGKALNVRTIRSELNQRSDILHAMLVTEQSEIQTFADAVIAHLVDSEIEQRQFEAEELRQVLLRGKLIAGNELIWNMRKAIGTDPRFAWDIAGEHVTIKV